MNIRYPGPWSTAGHLRLHTSILARSQDVLSNSPECRLLAAGKRRRINLCAPVRQSVCGVVLVGVPKSATVGIQAHAGVIAPAVQVVIKNASVRPAAGDDEQLGFHGSGRISYKTSSNRDGRVDVRTGFAVTHQNVPVLVASDRSHPAIIRVVRSISPGLEQPDTGNRYPPRQGEKLIPPLGRVAARGGHVVDNQPVLKSDCWRDFTREPVV